MSTEEFEELGPIDYVVLEWPTATPNAGGQVGPMLVDLVDRGLVRVLDLVFVNKGTDGTVTVIEVTDLDGDGELDLAIFQGASSGLVDKHDVASAGEIIAPGSSAAILIYENRWAAPFVHAIRRGGGETVAAGFIPMDDLLAQLDATD